MCVNTANTYNGTQISPEESQIISDSRFDIGYGQVSLFDGLSYILGGEATFTLVSVATGTRFTYQCNRAYDWVKDKKVYKDRWFLKVLSGPDNNSNYSYIGTIDTKEGNKWVLRFTEASKVSSEALSYISFKKVFDILQDNVSRIQKFLDKLEIFHDGTCSICHKKLTTPISVAISMGPVCAPIAHKQFKEGMKARGITLSKDKTKFIYPAGYKGRLMFI